ncbi:MAG: heat shock protein HslJ [Aureispira sp.]|jgi:heat shock protein HslJ
MIGTKYIYFLFLCTILGTACSKKIVTSKATTEAANLEKTSSPIGSWTVISFPTNSKDSKTAGAQKSYIVNFDANNSMGLTLDINTCGTSYKVKDDMITFQEGMTCTEACCDSKEANFLTSQFRGSLKYSIEGSMMTIKTDKGAIQLINNKDGIIGTSWTAVSYKSLKSEEPTKFEKTYRLSFDKKRVNLNLDVNACNTEITYYPQISTLEMPKPMGCTRKCCDSEEGLALMKDLKGKIVYKKTGKQLTLSTSTQEINFVLYKEVSKEE